MGKNAGITKISRGLVFDELNEPYHISRYTSLKRHDLSVVAVVHLVSD